MGRFQRVRSEAWVTEQMPDGSIALFDQQSKGVYFLNASAAAAWVACGEQGDAASVARSMQAALKTSVSVETALAALAELQEKHLIESRDVDSEERAALASRRSMLTTIGTAAAVLVPVVLAMTAAEQKAYAAPVGSRRPV